MKKLLAVALALALFSCRGGDNAQGNEPQKENIGIALELEPAYAKTPGFSSAMIYPDSIVVVVDSAAHSYIIDKEKSFESVESPDYLWNFVVSAKDENCPPYDTIIVQRRMTDIFGEKGEWDKDRCLFSSQGKAFAANIKNEPEIPRKLFSVYPESKPFPKMVMENLKFYYVYNADSAAVPAFISSAKNIVIKDNKISFSDGEKTTDLEIIPLSDYEEVYSEGYNWLFYTKETENCPVLRFKLNAGFDFEKKLLKPEERWISLNVKDMGNFHFDFRSWDNLKRRICVTYPTEEEFQSTMEEGILPDLSE